MHQLHFIEDREHRAEELGVVLFWQVLRVNVVVVNQLLAGRFVSGRVLRQLFKSDNEGLQLLRRQLFVNQTLANGSFYSFLSAWVSHPQRGLRGVIRVSARDGRLFLLGLFALHTHALRHGHDSFIRHDSPFQFLPKASWAARRERTR